MFENGKYIFIQENTDDSWDYTIYNDDKTEHDGGIYDNEDLSMENVVKKIASLYILNKMKYISINYDVLFDDGFVFEI